MRASADSHSNAVASQITPEAITVGSMDLNTVETMSTPTSRDELWPLGPGDAVLAGGTWLFSEPQPHLRRLVDLTSARLAADHRDRQRDRARGDLHAGRGVGAVDPVAGRPPEWAAAPLLPPVLHRAAGVVQDLATATVGGNVCLSFPAGAMISLRSALDGELRCGAPTAATTGCRSPSSSRVRPPTSSAGGDVLRSVHLPAAALRARTGVPQAGAFAAGPVRRRRHRPARTAADGGRFVLSVTAATVRPYVFTFPSPSRRRRAASGARRPSPTTPGPTTRTATPTGAGP